MILFGGHGRWGAAPMGEGDNAGRGLRLDAAGGGGCRRRGRRRGGRQRRRWGGGDYYEQRRGLSSYVLLQ